jgi:hypothetical protein
LLRELPDCTSFVTSAPSSRCGQASDGVSG